MREFLPQLESDDIDELLLPSSKNLHADALESVTEVLQIDDATVSDACALFDAVIRKYPDTTNRLSSYADIVQCPNFESAIVKTQRNNSGALSPEEAIHVDLLLQEEERQGVFEEEDLSFKLRALKQKRCSDVENVNKYIDTRFILPFSNICERPFSMAGIALLDRRKRFNYPNLEEQLFLHFNNDLWRTADVIELTLG